MSYKNQAVCISIMFLLLSACGGGSGGSLEVDSTNKAPRFTSSISIDVDENSTDTSYVATATDVDSSDLTFSLIGGADEGLFALDGVSGELSFNEFPDFEDPQDFDSNNTYLIEINVSDGSLSVSKSIVITVININEAEHAPTATIAFPPVFSSTNGNSIYVRGSASSEGRIETVKVNGVEANSSDNFTTWDVLLPLTQGMNTLIVETRDTDQNANSSAATVNIEYALAADSFPNNNNEFVNPTSISLDTSNDRLLIVDNELDSIFSVNLNTSERSVFSDNTTPNGNTPFVSPGYITLDINNNRALVTDISLEAVIAVDLITGERSVLSDDTIPNGALPFGGPIDISLDSANNRVLVTNLISEAITGVDLTTGARHILSDEVTPNADNPFNDSRYITIDGENNRALVQEFGFMGKLFEVSLTNGARDILSDENTPNAENAIVWPESVAIDNNNQRALILDDFSNAVISIDLDTGQRSILSSESHPNEYNILSSPQKITINTTKNISFIVDNHLKAIIVMDLVTGQRVVLSR
jgi:hypothetical protein